MKEAFELIKKKLEEMRMRYFLTIANGGDERNDAVYEGISKATDHALSIVSEVEAEYKDKFVSVGALEQVMWERDVAIAQLKELGYGLGEKVGWIPCSERFPENTDDVLVTTSYGLVIDAYLSTHKNWCFRNGTRITDSADMPIAWMPLPEPYRRESE